jgi:hypothetical protein
MSSRKDSNASISLTDEVDEDLRAWLAAIVFDGFSREHGSGGSYVEPTRARQCQLSWVV